MGPIYLHELVRKSLLTNVFGMGSFPMTGVEEVHSYLGNVARVGPDGRRE